MIRIGCVGDIMPGGVLHQKECDVASELKVILDGLDLRLGTLECAIGDEPTFDPVKMGLRQDVIYAPNVDLDKLLQLKIDCVSLANNHAFDLGERGLINTINQLDKLGIKYCGAGLNIEEASRPAVFEIGGKRIGVTAFCDYREEMVGYVPVATESQAGMNSLMGDYYVKSIRKLSQEFDYLIVLIHWGIEHSFWPTPEMQEVAQKCVKAGASVIVGGHQHRIQPMSYIGKVPVMWGLGNFLFPPRYLRPPRPMYYPSADEDTSLFPVTDIYPWVDVPTFKIWKYLGCIGSIGLVTLGSKVSAVQLLVRLKEYRKLETILLNELPFSYKFEYRIVSLCLKCGPYKPLYSLQKQARKGLRVLLKIFRKQTGS